MPRQTSIVGPDKEILLVVDGVLLLPLGAVVRLGDTLDALVVGVRYDATEGEACLILEVGASGSSLELAALEEAAAEADVVAAAEEITAADMSDEPD